MYSFRKQVVAVIGATGQVGTPLTKSLLSLGHEVKVFSRGSGNPKLTEFQDLGAAVRIVPDIMKDVDKLKEELKGVEVLICAVPANEEIVTKAEPMWLKAAKEAGVKRFVPTEFGCHTRGLDYGDGVLFDWKKKFQEELSQSGIGWTLFYNGGIFDYFLPNLRFFEKITTFGNMDIPIVTHEIEDIGRCAAMALTDERTMNKCVQMDFNSLSQSKAVELLKANFPDHKFEFEHFSEEFITNARLTASNEVTSKKGAETDRERWGINYVIYVKGKLTSFDGETLRATELYPDFACKAKPEDALNDPKFVFEETK